VLLAVIPAVIAGYVLLAGVVASLLPPPTLPPATVLALACVAMLGRAAGRGFETGGPPLARGGLTQLLVAPIGRRALLAEWVVTETLAATVLALGLMAWLAVTVLGLAALPRLPGLLLGTATCAAAAVGLRGGAAILAPALPRGARRALALAGHGVAGGAAVAIAVALLGGAAVAAPGPLAGAVACAAGVGAPFATVMAAPAPSAWWAVPVALAGGLWALPLLLAGRADGLELLLAATSEAERRRPERAATGTGALRAPAFGHGAIALVWKVAAERGAGGALLRPVVSWSALLSIGLAIAWLGAPGGAAAPVALATFAVLGGAPLAGRGTPGLAGELGHPAWLLRLPLRPESALAALLVPPVVRLAAAAALLAGPLAIRTPGALPATLTGLLAGAVVVFAAHVGRARCWLAEPPWQRGDAEAANEEVRALAAPPALAVAVGGCCWLAGGWPLPLVLLAAALPAAAHAALRWSGLVRTWRALEMVPRVAGDPRAA
jgi:hypothetical protein